MTTRIAALLIAMVLPGCVSLGGHQREMAKMRKADFEFAYDLAKQVREHRLRPAEMRVKLRERYNQQEEEQEK